MNSTPLTAPTQTSGPLQEFEQTLAVCSRQLDAFHVSLQTAARLGATKGAICIADPALNGRLVVRLSFGMEQASNRVLAASGPGETAAFTALAQGRPLAVRFADGAFRPTELELSQGIAAAAYLPIRTPAGNIAGLLLAVPAAASFSTETLAQLGQIAERLGARLNQLRPPSQDPDSAPAWRLEEPLLAACRECINTPNVEELSEKTLDYCRRFTGSDFGFVGYLEPETGHLVCPTMTREIYPQCQVAGKTVVFEKAGGLGGYVLDHMQPLLANDPGAHPASVGTPPGHLPIRKFMGVPCLSQGVLVGMIALANKEGDYGPADLSVVSAFADIYAAAVARFFSERELIASRNRYSQLYQEAPCGYHTIAPDGRLTDVNETAVRLLERPRSELLGGINLADLLTTTGRRLLTEQFESLHQGRPAAPAELHFKRPDGSRVAALHSVVPVRGERGELLEIRCTVMDLSLGKELRETREYLHNLFKSSASPIMVFDSNLTITRFNSAFESLSGYGADEVLGKPLDGLLPETGREAHIASLAGIAHGAQLAATEIPIRTREGTERSVLWNSSNVYAEDGVTVVATIIDGVDITERKQYERALRRTNRALKTLSRGNEALVHADDEEELTQQVCDILVQVGGYRMAWIGYSSDDPGEPLRAVAKAGHGAELADRIRVTWDDTPHAHGPSGTALRTREPQAFQDVLNDARFAPWRSLADESGYRSAAAFPLQHAGKLFGSLTLYGATPGAFDAEELMLLTELAGDLGFGIATLRTRGAHQQLEEERRHYLQRLNASMQATVQAIAATIEKRDPYTAGHQTRVARLAVAIAKRMGLSPDQVEGVHFGALIHDIGKISVPNELLSKPGKLSEIEFRIIQLHAEGGYEIVAGVNFPWPIAAMVRQHHERLDGSGYPHHLKGDEITLEARILAVADVVEAMSSPRPYRAAVGVTAALAEITRNSGRLYDSRAVTACVQVIEGGFRIDA